MIHRVAALILALFGAQAAHGWGYFGHETTARIALANVEPRTRVGLARLYAAERELGTPECRVRSLAEASTWPDCIRGEGWRWGYTFAWHFQTQPIGEEYDPRKNCGGGACVSAQIARNHRILADERLPANVRLEALAFMVHFAGDIHMPLHSGDNQDRGGNDVAATYGIAPGRNLHAIWDGVLAERAITNARPPLVRRYTVAERSDLAGGGPVDWGRESHALARDLVYTNALGRPPVPGEEPPEAVLTQEAIAAALPIAERRIAQAGLRIAELLDSAFAPGPLPEPERAPR
ncbi:S1/P1 nuclease [Qipengyuania sediminis]|uniref:S1/P1 nuclease n=1 Tax=Qipengyuania sediminis TaxID=1532023 RepID=UPI001F106862|nr:S1/P1 nuclease [Qipengyuania sediminis]